MANPAPTTRSPETAGAQTPAREQARRAKRRLPRLSTVLNIAIIAAFALLIAWCVVLVRDKLLSNAQDMGTNLAESYASEEQARFDSFEQLLEVGTHLVDDDIASGADPAALRASLETYAGYLADVVGSDTVDPYAVIDGRIVTAAPWEGDPDYDFSSAAWYRNALEAGGSIVYTDVYTDAVTGRRVVTLSCALAGEGNVLAFDIRLSDFMESGAGTSLPRDSSYFLTDSEGNLIYASSSLDLSDEGTRAYLAGLVDAILDGRLANYDDTIPGIGGEPRVVYYAVLSSGWISVVTIPVATVLQDGWDTTLVAIAAVCAALVAVLVVTMVREHRKNREIKYATETLALLGDTFYAIYRIDLARGRYVTVKSSPDVRQILEDSGAYDRLLAAVGGVVESSTHAAFIEGFALDHIRELFREGVREFGGDYQRRFGSEYKWVSIRIFFNDEIGIDEAVMGFREIDNEKRVEIQRRVLLENALSTAEQASKRKSDLVSNVSHDLRTPLTAIIGLSELAQRTVDDAEKTGENLRKIERSGHQMLALVNDLLDMARLEHGTAAVSLSPTDLAGIVRRTANMFEVQAESDGKRLVVEVPERMGLVMADELRIGQVLMNLVSNAVKYTEEGDTVRVALRRATEGDAVSDYQLVVEDDGLGMSKEFLERIFEPYARETMFSARKVAGTGLGMPIVKSIVTQMDGTIQVESELGRGTRITVTLPLEAAPRDEAPEGGAAANEDAQEAAPVRDGGAHADDTADEGTPPDPLQGARVLVADDTDINREIIQEYLFMLGATIVPARNGREAVELFERSEVGEIACILMDMRMPEMDGCEATQAIRALPRADAPSVPIIAITANASPEDVARTSAAGMDGHVTKPVDFASFTQVMRTAVAKAR